MRLFFDQKFIPMRLLIILLLFTPSTLFAQEGTIEYSAEFEMQMPSIEMVMENLPPGIPLDSAMIEQGMKMFSQFQNQIQAIPMLMNYSRSTSLLTFDLPASATNTPLGVILSYPSTFTDYTEGKTLSAVQNFDGDDYIIVDEFEPLDWVFMERDNTILNYPVKQVTFSSDTLNVMAWYAPQIASAAGPLAFGGLPGLPLMIMSSFSSEDSPNFEMNFSAVRLEEGTVEPFSRPKGELITREEWMKMMLQNINPFQQ